jgi:hypothetical protein
MKRDILFMLIASCGLCKGMVTTTYEPCLLYDAPRSFLLWVSQILVWFTLLRILGIFYS